MVWRIVNVGLISLSLWGGYNAMSTQRVAHTNPDPALCLILLVVMAIFALGVVSQSKCDNLQRPSWSRNPLNWRHDPLQGLFIVNLAAMAYAIGSALRLPQVGRERAWSCAAFWCIALGLLIGQALVYKRYRLRITE